MRYLGRLFLIMAVGLTFIITLALNLPVHYWTSLLLPPQVELNNVSGRLLTGQAQHIQWTPSKGWPLSLGPIQWDINLLSPSHITLGQAWQITIVRHGWTLEWQLTGGDMAVVDMDRWPMQLSGEWGGRLQIRTRGLQCLEASGGLSSHNLMLHLPEPVLLTQSRLTAHCPPNPTSINLTWHAATPPDIELNGQLDIQSQGGEGQIRGHIASDNPLAALLKLARPQLNPAHIQWPLQW